MKGKTKRTTRPKARDKAAKKRVAPPTAARKSRAVSRKKLVELAGEAPHLRAREREILRRHRLPREQLALDELERHAERAEAVLELVRGAAEGEGEVEGGLGRERRSQRLGGRRRRVGR